MPCNPLYKLADAFQRKSPLVTAFGDPWVWRLKEYEPGKFVLRGVLPGDEDQFGPDATSCVDVHENGDVVLCDGGFPRRWFTLSSLNSVTMTRRVFHQEIVALDEAWL